MTALIVAVLLASLLGSLHCAGMCGPFVAFAVGADARRSGGAFVLHAAYHGGRLVTYTLLGIAAGALGAALDLGGSWVGVQRAAAIIAGAIMVLFGVGAILRVYGVRLPAAPLPPRAQRVVLWGHRAAMNMRPPRRALLIGLLSTLLPCGWLYAFAVTAAGTASPLAGGLTMAVFWAGTLPVLVSLGVGVQALSGALGKRLPLLTSLALVVVGVLCIAGRVTAPALARPTAPVNGSIHAAVEHIEQLDAASMPCCQPEAGD